MKHDTTMRIDGVEKSRSDENPSPSFGRAPEQQLVLVTGATGYVGGRLAPRLLEAGFHVRCMARDAARLQGRSWRDQVEVITADLLHPESLAGALDGVDVAYYLVHSLGAGPDFSDRDLRAAANFGAAAKAAGVKRILYLGGLGEPESALSDHLRSRQQTGDVLRECGIPVTEFRAGVIVGSGSISFEMIRYLTERLPVMICPRWAHTRIQPISIRNVLDYLVAALAEPASAGQVVEIGCADVITYAEMLKFYAEVRGLRRWVMSVPLLTPKLSSYWVHLVTPIPANIAGALIDGLRNEVVVRSELARRLFPAISPMDYRAAVKRALEKLRADEVETAWSDALSTSQADGRPVSLRIQEGMIIEKRQLAAAAPVHAIYRAFAGLGGMRGWLYMNWTWRVRGAIDRLAGGVGLRRGRRDADSVRVGEALDFWRVEAVEPDRLMRLRAEMKVPGKAWLQFEIKTDEGGTRLLSQTAFFAPKGLLGLLYWYTLYPIHSLIFTGMIRKIGERAVQLAEAR
jgi:uncharacterized protein YbjT (DUF2867 family)